MFASLLSTILAAHMAVTLADLTAGAARSYRADQADSPWSKVFDLSSKKIPPRVVVISCSDSRLDPQHIFGLEPGQCYNLRNPGNLVADDRAASKGSSEALASVDQLLASAFRMGVDVIAVLGHTECSTVEPLAHSPQSATAWSRRAGPLAELIAQHYGPLPKNKLALAAVAENVRQQRQHILSRSDVQKALKEKRLTSVEGFVYEMGPKQRGVVTRWSEDTKRFELVAGGQSELPQPKA